MKSFVFPGQGAQFPGMGKNFYDSSSLAKTLFKKADNVLGFKISDLMFNGTVEELKETCNTQPAIYLHSTILYQLLGSPTPFVVAGHSLGELSALFVAGILSFENTLRLVFARATAIQNACDKTQGTMAAVLGLTDKKIETLCEKTEGIVVAANYNCPGQLVISGAVDSVYSGCELMKENGAKRTLPLPVGGAFHSPFMKEAQDEFAKAVHKVSFNTPQCPIYQNVSAKAETNISIIKENLIKQITAPVKWTQSVQQMIADGILNFEECGPGKVLSGLIKKIDKTTNVSTSQLN